jgi:hypothetical protein
VSDGAGHARLVSSVPNKRDDQISNFASDQEKYHPDQIVDLLLEIGHGLRFLQSRREDGPQEENDGHQDQNYPYQLIHAAMPCA